MSSGVVRAFPVVCVIAVACAPDEERPPVIWSGDHLDFGTYEDADEVCGGTLQRADDFVGYVGGIFGVTSTVSYYWDRESLHPRCDQDLVGCSIGKDAFGKVPLLEHELVHAAKPSDTYKPLEEGIAQLLGAPVPPVGGLQGDITELYARHEGDKPMTRGWYPVAGYFASYLSAVYGRELLIELDRRASRDDSWEAMQGHFSEVYGISFQELVEVREDLYPACDQRLYQDVGFDCREAAPPVVVGDGTARIEASLDCSDPSVIGPQWGERWTTRTIEVEKEGVYEVRISKVGGEAAGHFEILECDRSCAVLNNEVRFAPAFEVLPVQADDELSIGLFVTIPAGRYVAKFSVAEDDIGDFVLTIAG